MESESENIVTPKVSALDQNVLNQLRFQKRNANYHLHIMSSLVTRSKLNLISSHRRNSIININELKNVQKETISI